MGTYMHTTKVYNTQKKRRGNFKFSQQKRGPFLHELAGGGIICHSIIKKQVNKFKKKIK